MTKQKTDSKPGPERHDRASAAATGSKHPDASAVPPEVAHLLKLQAAGKWKQAVELAKEHHKKQPSPQTELRLFEAYLGRIEQFQSKGAAEDARTLLQLVQQRFPAYRDRLLGLTLQGAGSAGDVDQLVAPLTNPDLPPDVREVIDTTIRTRLTDIGALAATSALPADHPLRLAAGAVDGAFTAVTTGPVTDEQVALPEVSRKSPLASWKLMIRALAAFYRNDDEGCRRALASLPADAAVKRWEPLLLGVIEHRPPAAGLAGALQQRINDGDMLRDLLVRCEKELAKPGKQLARTVQATISACAAERPELLDRLRQHLFVKGYLGEVNISQLLRMVPLPALDAYFWKLMASAAHHENDLFVEAMYWERFLAHAVHEKQFAPNSHEAALVHLTIAEVLLSMPKKELAREVWEMTDWRAFIEMFYEHEAPEVVALTAKDRWHIPTDPIAHLRKSAEIWPQASTYQKWIARSAGSLEGPATKQEKAAAEKKIEVIAEHWHKHLPTDVHPLLMLSRIAENRNALTLATKHLSGAEAIDPIHPAVREARLRLTMGVLRRHLKDKKPHLATKDIDELSQLPAMREGDGPAFVLVLRAVTAAVAKDAAAATQFIERAQDLIAPALAGQMLAAVVQTFNLKPDALPKVAGPATCDDSDISGYVTRLHGFFRMLGLSWSIPDTWGEALDKALARKPCPLPVAALTAIAELCIEEGNRIRAYAATAAGLNAPQDPVKARFLLIRAQALMIYLYSDRPAQCLRAARMLASRANDVALLDAIAALAESNRFLGRVMSSAAPLSDETLEMVLEAEAGAPSFPLNVNAAEKKVVLHSPFPFPFGAFGDFGDDDDDFDLDDDFDDEDDEL